MVYINEWFPNPVGSDAKGEFIELFNSGASTVNLNGWGLWTGGKNKKVSLGGFSIAPHEYLVLAKPRVKLSLKNTDGGLWLYSPQRELVDRGSFVGSAPEGESFSRTDYRPSPAQHFAFVIPTPGAANKSVDVRVEAQHYPTGVPLDPPLAPAQIAGLAIGMAVAMLGSWVYIFYKNEIASNFIFKRNADARRIDREKSTERKNG